MTPYVPQEAVADAQRVVAAALELSQEVLTVEVIELLQVPKNDAALPPQVLGQIQALHLREVAFNDVAQRPDVLPLRGHHLIDDVPQLAAGGNSWPEGTLEHRAAPRALPMTRGGDDPLVSPQPRSIACCESCPSLKKLTDSPRNATAFLIRKGSPELAAPTPSSAGSSPAPGHNRGCSINHCASTTTTKKDSRNASNFCEKESAW